MGPGWQVPHGPASQLRLAWASGDDPRRTARRTVPPPGSGGARGHGRGLPLVVPVTAQWPPGARRGRQRTGAVGEDDR